MKIGEVIATERLIAEEASDLVVRRPDLRKMVLGLYALSFLGAETSRVIRASYLPIRLVDDLLDGDATGPDKPCCYARDLSNRIEAGRLNDERIDRQLEYALGVLETKARPDDDPRGDFVKAIGAILFDRERAAKRQVLSAEEIEAYYHKAFDPVVNLTLIGIGSSLRAADVPAMSYGQGRVYTVRDFAEDWRRGIINIPGSIIDRAGLEPDDPTRIVAAHPVIASWLQESLANTRPDLVKTQALLRETGEWRTRVVLGSLIPSMLKFINSNGSKLVIPTGVEPVFSG